MMNTGVFRDISPKTPTSDLISCVHSGAAVSDRGLENMIRVFLELPERFTLDLYLVPGGDGGAYLHQLQELASGSSRIRFHEPVPSNELPLTLSKYDVGVHWIPADLSANTRLALPNKFFDYVQARIGIAIGPSLEMASIHRKFQLGTIASSFEPKDLRDSILSLDSGKIEDFKKNAGSAAKLLSFEEQVKPIRQKVASLFQR
jgi:hypothetical protein